MERESDLLVGPVAIASGFCGALIGAVAMPTWQVAVESAQVLAGEVVYPADNAFQLYHASTWTLLHQISALMLRVGISESVLAVALSAGLGALTFASLALCTFGLCRQAAVAVFAPMFAFAVFGGSDMYGLVYPVYLAGTHHTYGVAGRGLALLVVALLGLGRWRTAAFSLGLMPAIHPTWGIFTWAVTGAGIVLSGSRRSEMLLPCLRAFGVGLGIAVTSLVMHRVFVSPGLRTDPGDTWPLVEAFLTLWDVHRQPVNFTQPGFRLGAVVTVLCLLAAMRGKQEDGQPDIAVMLTAAGVFGIAGAMLTHAQGWLPFKLQLVMPGRFINLVVFALPAVFVGLAARFAGRRAGSAVLAVLIAYPPVVWGFRAFLSSDRWGWDLPHLGLFYVVAIVLLGLLLLPADSRGLKSTVLVRQAPAAGAVVLLFGALLFSLYPRATGIGFEDDDPTFAYLREGEGMVIGPSAMELLQLRTRRPLLVNTGALDQVMYVPVSAPATARVLEGVYGVDLVNPPERIRVLRPGALPPGIEAEVWANRSVAEWTAIGREFGAWTVLSRTAAPLDLPVEFVSERYCVYGIPKE